MKRLLLFAVKRWFLPVTFLSCTTAAFAVDAFQWQNPTPRGNTFSTLSVTAVPPPARGDSEVVISEDFGRFARFLAGGQLTGDLFSRLVVGSKRTVMANSGKSLFILEFNDGSGAFFTASRFGVGVPFSFPGAVGQVETAWVDPDNPDVMLIGTSVGTAWRTTDCGGSWSEHFVTSLEAVVAIHAGSPGGPQTPTAVLASGAFLTSTDGGVSWAAAFSAPVSPAADFDTDTSVGTAPARAGTGLTVVAGAFGSIVRSTDKGVTWSESTLPPFENFNAVSVLDATRAMVCGDKGIIKVTVNAGASWFTGNSGTNVTLRDIRWVDTINAYCVGEFGTVLSTTDGGITWGDLVSGPRDAMYDVQFPSAMNGFVVGEDGRLGRTTNGGATWQFEVTSATDDLFSVEFVDDMNGWIGGWRNNTNALVKTTTDGGVSWSDQTIGFGAVRLQFPDALNGWAGGLGGLFRTTDAGANWAPNAVILDSVIGFFFFDETTGFVGTTSGSLVATTDGGTTWSFPTGPAFAFGISSIHFPSALVGFAADQGGRIARTTDGGLVWDHTVDLPTSDSIEALHFPTPTVGFAVGFRGDFESSLHRTTNGGDTWEDISADSEVGHRLRGLYFRDDLNGTIVGDGGAILATATGGTSAVQLSGLAAAVVAGSGVGGASGALGDGAASVQVSWNTSAEIGHDGFHVYRSDYSNGRYERQTTSLVRGRSPYSWVDRNVRPGFEYWYEVGAVDTRGGEQRFGPVSVVVPRRTMNDELVSIRPNPAIGRTEIRFVLAVGRAVDVSVHDAAGRLVRKVVDGEFAAGEHTVIWDGRGAEGRPVAAGVYFVRLLGEGLAETEKVVRIR